MVAVVAQAVWVCIPHTAGLVLVDNWDTEVLDHSGRGLEIIKMETNKQTKERLLRVLGKEQ